MLRKISIAMSLMLLLGTTSPMATAYSSTYELSTGGYAIVLEVIDGESIKVKMKSTGQIGYVRMIGVDANAYDTAKTYLNSSILGDTVFLSFDQNVPKMTGTRWNNMYVQFGDNVLNEVIAQKGYATADYDYGDAEIYPYILNAQSYAKTNEMEMWNSENRAPAQYIPDDIPDYYNDSDTNTNTDNNDESVAVGSVNINTALADDFTKLDYVLSSSLIENIIYYRKYNMFNTIDEIKFVPGMTATIFNEIKSELTVYTNINNASAEELATINAFSDVEIENIINFASENTFVSINELLSNELISEDAYTNSANFLSTKNIYQISKTYLTAVYDLNTISTTNLYNLGLSSYEATIISNYRENYNYKTIEEIAKLPGVTISTSEINRIEDNLNVDVNSYLVNLNTATQEQIEALGFSDALVAEIIEKQGSMNNSADIPTSALSKGDYFTLYTNINTASYEELMCLGDSMTTSFADSIILYRQEGLFGTESEVSSFFTSKGFATLYSEISDFIVLR